MNNKWVFLGILLLVGLMLSACVSGGGYGYGYGYGSGYYNYSHGYPYRDHYRPNQDDRNQGSEHGSNYWR
jgi:hypothetical protein